MFNATQHRVTTDAPGGAFKIRPILVKVCAIYPAPRLQGARLNANRWAACGLWTVFVWVRFAVLRVCSVRQAVIQGKRPRRLIYNRRRPISTARSRIVRRSFVAVNLVQPNTALHLTALSGRFYRLGSGYKPFPVYLIHSLQGCG